jgi:hypothetical protein
VPQLPELHGNLPVRRLLNLPPAGRDPRTRVASTHPHELNGEEKGEDAVGDCTFRGQAGSGLQLCTPTLAEVNTWNRVYGAAACLLQCRQ